MERKDYEKHLVGELCRGCHAATHGSAGRQRQCPRCRRKWSYARRRQQGEILKAFVLGATAHPTARTLRISYPTVWRHDQAWRRCLWALSAAERPPLCGEIEADESYFGGRRKGRRGRGAAGKVRVFGLLERGGQGYSVVVPDGTKETLRAKIQAHSVKGSVYDTDAFSGDADLRSHGKHLPVNHQESFAHGPSHINGLEAAGASPRAGPARPTASRRTTSPATSVNTSSASTTATTTCSSCFTARPSPGNCTRTRTKALP